MNDYYVNEFVRVRPGPSRCRPRHVRLTSQYTFWLILLPIKVYDQFFSDIFIEMLKTRSAF